MPHVEIQRIRRGGRGKEPFIFKDIAVEDYVTLGQFEALRLDLESPRLRRNIWKATFSLCLPIIVYTLVTDRQWKWGCGQY